MAGFFSEIACLETRAALWEIFTDYQEIGLLLSAHRATHLIEVGPGTLSIAALALAGHSSAQPLTYIGLEKDSGRARQLRMFMKEYFLKGEVCTCSIFDLDIRALLPEGNLVFCFEHSLEDIVLAGLAEKLNIHDSCWTHTISSVEASAPTCEDRLFAAVALDRVFSAMESLSVERPKALSLIHHYNSPRYEGSSLQWLDTEVRERSWRTLTAQYETLLSLQPESGLSNEFWWFGHMIPKTNQGGAAPVLNLSLEQLAPSRCSR